MAFQGYGNQADSEIKRPSNRGGEPRGFNYTEPLPNDKRHYLNLFELNKGEKDRQVILLDDIKSEEDPQFAALIHAFWYKNRSNNIITSLEGIDERGCPISHALRRRPIKGGAFEPRMASSVWFLTALDLQPFTFERGPRSGQSVQSRRVLIPVPRGRTKNSKVSRVEEFMTFAQKLGGLRFQTFQVSRGTDQTAAKIGDIWWPTRQQIDITELRRRFAHDAEVYGFPTVDDYLKPVDYFNVMKPKSYDELKKAVEFIEADRRQSKSPYDRLDDDVPAATSGRVPARSEVPASVAAADDDEGSDLPF